MAPKKNDQPSYTRQSIKAEYGISKAILDQNPDLKAVLDGLMADMNRGIEYQPADIALKIKNTDWFRKHTSDWMQIEKDRLSKDSRIWDAVVQQRADAVMAAAREAGAEISEKDAREYGEKMIYGSGWNGDSFEVYDENWLQKTLASAIDFTQRQEINGVPVYDLSGAAEANAERLYQMAYDYGIDSSMSNDMFTRWFEKSLTGFMDGSIPEEDLDDELRTQALSAFPGMAPQLQRGLSLREAANPYLTALANTLEVDAGSLDLNDDLVQRVLNNVGQDGQFKPMSIYDAKIAARRDGRWQYTSTAKKEYTDVASQILRDFGFLG